jgi:hypothetical protein
LGRNECYFISARNLKNGQLRWHGNIELTEVERLPKCGSLANIRTTDEDADLYIHGKHMPSALWEFEIQNRTRAGRTALTEVTNSSRNKAKDKKKEIHSFLIVNIYVYTC